METVEECLKTEFSRRDEHWERAFLLALQRANVMVTSPEPRQGPDRWPYLFVSTAPNKDSEPLANVLGWLSTRGIGLAVNAEQATPDFVLSYGMVWNCRERGEFLSASPQVDTGPIEIPAAKQVMVGVPSTAYLPEYVRTIIRQFLKDQGVSQAKVLMADFEGKGFDLCFSIESLNSPPEAEHSGIAEALSWFLPAHYSIALVSEKLLGGFVTL